MLELHVWGPAFSLPSIDPHCLAAIAYLQQAVPQGEWELIASSNPALSPTNELPALRNGDIWIGGFRNIFHYIAQFSSGEWVLDAGLPDQQGADCIAFSSFVESHGRSLLDLSLYVSSHNYDVVRPLYNKIQPFPLPYLTPPSVRSAAKLRTAHLGLSSLDMDTDPTIPPSSDPHSLIPASLRTKAPSVTSLLSTSPETNSRIRLDALAQNFFEPLQEFKNSKRFFVSESQFSSLDCLALGFLSLMLIPELPQSWLRDTMKEKYPELCEYVEVLRQDIYGLGLDVADAFQPQPQSEKKHARKLPWKSPNSGGILGISGVFISSIADSIPVFGQLRRNTRMRQHGGKTTENDISSSYLGYLTAAGATVGVLAGLLFYGGLSPFESQGGRFAGMLGGAKEKKRLRDLGEAGLLFDEQFDFEERQMRHQPMGHETKIPVVDVEVSRDGVSASDDVI